MVWESEDETHPEIRTSDVSHIKLATFVCGFLLAWHTIFRILNMAIGVFFRFFSLFLLKLSEISVPKMVRSIYDVFPNTLAKAEATL